MSANFQRGNLSREILLYLSGSANYQPLIVYAAVGKFEYRKVNFSVLAMEPLSVQVGNYLAKTFLEQSLRLCLYRYPLP
jgi:hypothetical protein